MNAGVVFSGNDLERFTHGKGPELRDALEAAATRDKWGNYCWDAETFNRIRLKHSPLGVGDAVAVAVKPLAKLLGLENCAGCMGRQAFLNELLPLT